MEKYRQERARQQKLSRMSGGILTVVIHVAMIACFFVTGFKYLDPPPPERTPILIDFTEPEIKKPEQTWKGTKPTVAEPVQRQLDKRPLSPGTSREASGVPCLNPRRGLTLLSPVCRDPAIGV